MNKPEKKIWKLDSDERRDKAVVVVQAVPIGPDHPVMKLTLEVWRDKRSAAQQGLMWVWHGQWSKHFGDSVNEEHIRFKRDYLLPLLLRDRVIECLDELYRDAEKRLYEQGDIAGLTALYHLISTNALNTSQFAEILTQYEQDTSVLGLAFTVLGPQYDEAMGK